LYPSDIFVLTPLLLKPFLSTVEFIENPTEHQVRGNKKAIHYSLISEYFANDEIFRITVKKSSRRPHKKEGEAAWLRLL